MTKTSAATTPYEGVTDRYLAELSTNHSPSTIAALLSNVLREVGIKQFAYGSLRRVTKSNFSRDAEQFPFFISNFNRSWVSRYQQKGYIFCDPVIIRARATSLPFLWGLGIDERRYSCVERKIMEEAAQFGLQSGLAIPFHEGTEVSLFVASTDRREASSETLWILRHTLQLIATYTHLHATRIRCHKAGCRTLSDVLSQSERECLAWAAEGKSSWETGRITGRSQATVNFHMRNVVRKLNAANKVNAVAKAALYRLIPLPRSADDEEC